jgi:hypothetical protein
VTSSVDAVQPLLMQQVVKAMLESTDMKDSPFAALLQTALAGEVKPS